MSWSPYNKVREENLSQKLSLNKTKRAKYFQKGLVKERRNRYVEYYLSLALLPSLPLPPSRILASFLSSPSDTNDEIRGPGKIGNAIPRSNPGARAHYLSIRLARNRGSGVESEQERKEEGKGRSGKKEGVKITT